MTVTARPSFQALGLCQSKGGVVSRLVADPLGSINKVRDAAGAIEWEAEHDPYGNLQSKTGTSPSELLFVGTLGYITDSAFGLYVRARCLQTNLGRLLTRDPLSPSKEGYVFAPGYPDRCSDPSGKAPIGPIIPGEALLLSQGPKVPCPSKSQAT